MSSCSFMQRDEAQIFLSMLDALQEMVCVLEDDGLSICYANAALIAATGLDREALYGQPVSVLSPDGDIAPWRELLLSVDEHGQALLNTEVSLRAADGSDLPVAVTFQPIVQGQTRCLMLMAGDLRLPRKFHARVSRLVRFYQALLAIHHAVIEVRDELPLYEAICHTAVQLGGMTLAWIGQPDEQSGVVRPLARFGVGTEFLDQVKISVLADSPHGWGATGNAYRSGRGYIVNDYLNDPATLSWRQQARLTGWRSSGSFPIFREGRVAVILGLYHTEPGVFDVEMVQLIEALTQAISFALDHLGQERARQQLEDRVKMAALVFEHSSQPMLVADRNNDIISVNHAYEQMTGYALDELRGRNPRVFNSGCHDAAFYAGMWQDLEQQRFWQGRVWNRRKNGEVYPEWMTINVVLGEDGLPDRYVATSSDISDKVKFEETIWRQANFDLLTSLPNRYMAWRQLEAEIARTARGEQVSLAVLHIDLDQFKQINDILGHQAGDALLVDVAARIAACAGDASVTCRLNGDEFAILLLGNATLSHAAAVAQCVLAQLASPVELGPDRRKTYISASIGVALYPLDASGTEDLLQKAEQAMHVSKEAGRNRVNFYASGMQEKVQHRLQLLHDMRGAMEQGQFFLQFQPVVDMESGRVVKAEALLRWQHPTRGRIDPGTFIPLAEESGLIVPIGDWVFHQAAEWVRRVMAHLDTEIQVSVNMSPVQFRDDAVHIASWLAHLQAIGLSTRHVAVEITEGLLMDASEQIFAKLLDFRNAGVQVALDDFGTGYSALSYLRRFDIDFLKIDQSFVRNMVVDESAAALVEAIVVMAHKLGLKVIAEGVETREQHERLRHFDCDFGQGYLYAKPLDEAEFLQFTLARDRASTDVA